MARPLGCSLPVVHCSRTQYVGLLVCHDEGWVAGIALVFTCAHSTFRSLHSGARCGLPPPAAFWTQAFSPVVELEHALRLCSLPGALSGSFSAGRGLLPMYTHALHSMPLERSD